MLDKAGYQKCIHPVTINEINKNPNKETVATFNAKLSSYEVLRTSAPIADEVALIAMRFDLKDNDKVDTQLINELFCERVDLVRRYKGPLCLKSDFNLVPPQSFIYI
jgi:hypothetical protein